MQHEKKFEYAVRLAIQADAQLVLVHVCHASPVSADMSVETVSWKKCPSGATQRYSFWRGIFYSPPTTRMAFHTSIPLLILQS